MLAIERIGAGLAAQVGMLGRSPRWPWGMVLLGEPVNLWVLAGTVLAGVFCSRFPKP